MSRIGPSLPDLPSIPFEDHSAPSIPLNAMTSTHHPLSPIREVTLLILLLTTPAWGSSPRWVISANEGKIDLSSGTRRVLREAPPDTVTLLDFAQFPPSVRHLTNISNTVLGPPSNVAITPDGRFALIADSVRLDSSNTNGYRPARRLHLLDLVAEPPRVVAEGEAGEQVSGVCVAPNGRTVLVANRASGSVSVLRLEGASLRTLAEIPLALPVDEVSDVAITPDGRRAFVSVRERGHLRELILDGEKVTATSRKFSTYGRPYRVLVTPDSQLVLTAGEGAGNGGDKDALTVIDLTADPARATDFIALGTGPETLDLSPDGKLLIAVIMNGSNLLPTDPWRTEHGQIVLLERSGKTFKRRQVMEVGRIPEGAVFTPDGRHVVVQSHPERKLWILDVTRSGLVDSGLRIDVPGMPSGLSSMRIQTGR